MGAPAASTPHPGGTRSPCRRATSNRPKGTVVVAMSRQHTRGAAPAPVPGGGAQGPAHAIGLVPRQGFAARVGTPTGLVLQKLSPRNPCFAACKRLQ